MTLRFWLANEEISWSSVKSGPGRFRLARVRFAVKLSLLPSRTSQEGPRACKISKTFVTTQMLQSSIIFYKRDKCKMRWNDYADTSWEDVWAARARISAQETTPGQAFSTAVLIWFTTSKPRKLLLFGAAVCSLTMVSVSFNRTDASHPC